MDDVTAVRHPIWGGLGVLDRTVVRHIDSPGHQETRDCDELTPAGRIHWALCDGDVVLARSSTVERLHRKQLPPSR